MKTIEQIKQELQERGIHAININVWHYEGMQNDIELELDGCITLNDLYIISIYFGATPYVHNGYKHLRVTITDINKQTEGL